VSSGQQLRQAIAAEQPLQIVGVINAYAAIMAENAGFKALYLSGAGVANASIGIPDTGHTTLDDVLIDVIRINNSTDLPLLVDVDTGWEDGPGIETTVKRMISAKVAGIQIEDQIPEKLCGHLEGKKLVSVEDMVNRIKTAVTARVKNDLLIVARTDAISVEGLASAIDRSREYVDAGADIIFAEAASSIDEYKKFVENISVPVLANMTEFGKTPLMTVDELKDAGIGLVLYPLSAFRAMNAAAMDVYKDIRENGSQKNSVDKMQTRDELYRMLSYEKK